ncbi:MAG TPA: hypothetical protein DEF05_02970 [Erwinia sp.]|uniref:hypothetical protein n=1 Tax=Erwinia citreus TaxID=558 RepID=UPI000E95FDF4|nr:hypothetical protein [Erwinia sp.]HBV38665.1 hypothetical protein [Erwinia sp.]
MKKYALLIALVISGNGLAAVSVRPAGVQTATLCEPGLCLQPVRAGDELVRGMGGIDRQARRVLEPVSAGMLVDWVE